VLVREIKDILDAEIITGEAHLDTEVKSACGSDMMSDVLAFVKDQSVLLTGLVNPQVVRTAEMMDMRCIVFVRGKKPDAPVVSLAAERGIVLLSTRHRMFVACGLLYSHGLQGGALKSE
jgi:predicted transcriptional regulator